MPERAAATSEDRLGALPDALLLDVLSLLPADEAVQTCVLARRWRDLWRYAPGLRLVVTKQWPPRFGSAEQFSEFVNRLIVLRGRSPPLVSCEISLYPSDTGEPFPYAERWIQHALACQVRVLRVTGEDYMNPGLPLNARLVSRHLMILHLKNVDLFCSTDFSSCPVLEDLKISGCAVFAQEVSSRSLKRLSIAGCYFRHDHRTLISAPSLNSLQLHDSGGMTPLLESMPLLETACVSLDARCPDFCYYVNPEVEDCGDESCAGCSGYPAGSCQSVLLNGLSNAVNLELIAKPEVYIYKRDLASRPIFGKLKTLLLGEWVVAIDLRALASILQLSPILEILTLQLRDNEHLVSALGAEENDDPIEQSFACAYLKTVNIECQEVNEKVHKISEFLSTCGILSEQISIKKTIRWRVDRLSFERRPRQLPSTVVPEATPSTADSD